MRLTARKWRWVGLGLILAAVATLVIRTWVVPAVILSQIRAKYRGQVAVRSWWLGLHSAGIEGVALREGPGADSPEWLTAERIGVDVSLGSMIRGRFAPTRVTIERPRIKFRLDAQGKPATKIPLAPASGKPAAPLPEIVVVDAEATVEQAGRPPMTVTRVGARLTPAAGGSDLDVRADDPTWGKATVAGHFDAAFKNGEVRIASGPGFVADPARLASIPFIPPAVWANLEPRGPVDARVAITLAADAPKPVQVLTEITLKGTAARLATLQVEATGTTGRVVIDDALVKILDVKGKAVEGTLAAGGTLDFSRPTPLFHLDLRLEGVDVTKAPASWQLGKMDVTGRLTGQLDLKVALPPAGPDLSGTSGRAIIEDGSLQGIPIKSLSLRVRAEGNDLQYETLPQGSVDKKALGGEPGVPSAAGGPPGPAKAEARGPVDWNRLSESALAALPIVRMAGRERGVLGWAAFVASEAVGLQVGQEAGKPGGLRLPKTISTRVELEDVDLATILAKLERFGIRMPVPIAGRLSIKAAATIPIGAIRDIRAYKFRGDATLAGASVDHVDVGLLSARLELVDGVLDLSDFRGQLVDHPSGDAKNPPRPTAIPPRAGELPPGGFRAHLRASIAPKGPLTASIEGRQLPMGELLAPALPVPTPFSGELTIKAEARGDVANLADPRAWSLDAHADSRRIRYRGATLDQVATEVHLEAGRLEIAGLDATLAGHPLKASGGLDLAPPHRFNGQVRIAGWEIAEVLAFVPASPRPAPASGLLDADGRAVGTLLPFSLSTQGAARLLRAKAGPVPLGAVVLQWATDRDAVTIDGLEAHPFGGMVTGEARIPIRPGGRLEASMTLKGIDAARLSAALPGRSVAVSGKADGRLKVSMPMDASAVDAEALLVAPDLTVREAAGEGVRVRSLRVSARAAEGALRYEATAEGLGGKLRFHGSAPLANGPIPAVADAEFQAAGFRLNEAWRGLGITGGLAELDGVGAVDANLRASVDPFRLRARGIFELRALRYGAHLDLGGLRGSVSLTPTSWRLDEMTGELLGGRASGRASGESRPGGPRRAEFAFRVDRASLRRMLATVPELARGAEGYGSVHAAGQLAESLRATAEVQVARARVLGLPVSDLRFPAEIDLSPASGFGSIQSRHWTARVAGGTLRGSARLRLGEDRSFQSEVQITGADLETLSRLQPGGKQSASGKLSGKVSLMGPNPNNPARIRGRVDLDLDDASLVEVPLFRELDRFLGSSRGGGLFEDGAIHGTIANNALYLESMTLHGRLVQLHATGSVTAAGALDLQVLVNTNEIIPQSGLALVGLVPGLGQALGKGEQALMKIATFLENRLLKFRVSGTTDNPVVQIDTGVAVTQGAAGFFASAFRLPTRGR